MERKNKLFRRVVINLELKNKSCVLVRMKICMHVHMHAYIQSCIYVRDRETDRKTDRKRLIHLLTICWHPTQAHKCIIIENIDWLPRTICVGVVPPNHVIRSMWLVTVTLWMERWLRILVLSSTKKIYQSLQSLSEILVLTRQQGTTLAGWNVHQPSLVRF